jgi:autotransporter-associated beta strand protein
MKIKHSFTRIIGALALCALAALTLNTAQAQTTWYWDGATATLNGQSDNTTTTGENWLSGGNWDNGTVDAPLSSWTAGDYAVFGGSAASQTITASALTIGNLTFGGGGQGATIGSTPAYTISSSTITLSSGSTITANTPTTISSALAGSGLSLTVGGGSTLTLSGANTYTGGTTISSGAALTIGGSGKLNGGSYAGAIANAGTFTWNSSASQTLSGGISGTGALTVSGASTLTLTTTKSSYTGPTTINSGSTLTMSTNWTGTYAGNITDNGTFNLNAATGQTLTGNLSGSGALSFNPGGANGNLVYLRGNNSGFTGKTTIANLGQVIITSDSELGTPASFSASKLTLAGGFLRFSGTTTLNPYRGITLGAPYAEFGSYLGGSIQVDPGYTLTIPAPIADATYGGIMLFGLGENIPGQGSGTNQLTGTNTYKGPTVISNGRVLLSTNGSLPYGTTLIMIPDYSIGSFFDLGTNSQTIGPLSTMSVITGSPGSGTPTILVSSPNALTILQTNTATVFAGLITGSGSLTLAGNSSGKLSLSGYANTYTGGTTITGGTLDVTNGASISGNVTNTGGTLKLDNNTALSSTATLALAATPAAGAVNLNFTGTPQTVAALYFGSTPQATGTWGGTGSGATNINAAFTGTGQLLVCPTPDETITTTASVCAGATTNASVTITPGAMYAWTVANGTVISGATSNTVTYSAWAVGPVMLNCVVTSPCGVPSAGNQNSNVTVNICGPVVQSTNVVYSAVNGATITGTGVMGATWYLYASGDVSAPLPWPFIQAGTVTASPFTVTDPNATNYSQYFYYLTSP